MPFFDPIRIGASGAADTAFTVDRSLRFNDNDSAELERTPSSASNRRTFTFSFWVKRANLGIYSTIFGMQYSTSAYQFVIRFDNDDKLSVFDFQSPSGGMQMRKTSTAVFRDVSAWYHIVVAVDTTQSTGSYRNRVYVNNNELTSFSSENTASQNHDTIVNTTNTHYIGQKNSGSYFDGYLAEFNFIDGQQLTPSSFAETNATTGQWIPKDTSGLTFGTNGYRLQFADNSGTTATTLGKDSSGNSNNFTPSNFSVSAGVGNDSLEDTPTNNFPTLNVLDLGGGTSLANGNLDFSTSGAGGARSTFGMSSGKYYAEVTLGSSTLTVGLSKDNSVLDNYLGNSAGEYSYGQNGNKINGDNGSQTGYGDTFTTGDTIGIAFDADGGNLYFYKNGALQASGTAAFTGLTDGPYFFAVGNNVTTSTSPFNFGQRPFANTIPTGYKELNSANLPDPTIKLPNQHFNTLLYTGDGSSTRTFTGVGFKPDWTWKKERNQAYSIGHMLYDSVRGLGVDKHLDSSTNLAEGSGNDAEYGYFTGFTSDGFSVSAGSSGDDYVNDGSNNYVTWNWNAGDTDGKTYAVKVVSDSGNKYRFDDFGTSAVTLDLAEGGTYIFDQSDSSNAGHPLRFSTTADGTHGGGSEYTTGVTTAGTPGSSGAYTQIVVAASAPNLAYYCTNHSGMGGSVNTNSTLGSSNFDGSIQTITKVNTNAGFSVTTYSGTDTGSSQTIGHGLGVAPKLWIFKNRSSTSNWVVYTTAIDGGSDYIILNSTNASASGVSPWDTAPTSSVITVGTNNTDTCNAGDNYVLYAISEVEGYSKVGKFTGNGNDDGMFVFCGFRPSFILIRSTSSGRHWVMNDTARNPQNVANKTFLANASNAEDSGSSFQIDILSNGFKCRTSGVHVNTNGGAHLFLAFAEAPFKNARAR